MCLQVHYPPYLFECFLFASVYDKKSAAEIGNGVVLFKLEKQEPQIWELLQNPDAGEHLLPQSDNSITAFARDLPTHVLVKSGLDE